MSGGSAGPGELEGLGALHDHAAIAVEREGRHAGRDHLRHREAAGFLDDEDRLVGSRGMLDAARPSVVAARCARRRGAARIGLGSSRRATGGGARGEDDGEHDEETRGGSFHGRMDAGIRGSVPEHSGDNDPDAPHGPPPRPRAARRPAGDGPRARVARAGADVPQRAARLALRSARRRPAGRDGSRLSLGRSQGQPRAPRQPAAADPDVAVHERPRRDRRGVDVTDRGVRGLPVQRPHGPAPAADARCAAAAAGRRTDHPDAPGQHADDPATPAVGAPQPGREGDLVPGRDLGALRRGELGMALQHALRRGAREPAAPLLPARDLPCRGPPLLVAGRRCRSLTVADAVPGAPLLPLPGAATELVPRRLAAERRPGPVSALRHEPAHVGAEAARGPAARRGPHVGGRRSRLPRRDGHRHRGLDAPRGAAARPGSTNGWRPSARLAARSRGRRASRAVRPAGRRGRRSRPRGRAASGS